METRSLSSIVEESVKVYYDNCHNNDFEEYLSFAGWESWMESFVEDEEPTDAEIERIEKVQRTVFNNFFNK